MKKNKLGITEGKVESICVVTSGGSFYKVTGESESICNVTTRNSERAVKTPPLSPTHSTQRTNADYFLVSC